jgi:hypothetical protein
VRVLEATRKKLPDVLSRPDLEMVALDYFRRFGHDNHRRLSKLYAWEEKKCKTSWGAETVDYEKRVSGFVLANTMKPPKSSTCSWLPIQCSSDPNWTAWTEMVLPPWSHEN